MQNFADMTCEEIAEQETEARRRYDALMKEGISINMARGKPSPEQLDLSDGMLGLTRERMGIRDETGFDCRNYGELRGIPECRRLFGEIMGLPEDQVIACGSSSLNLMYDYISQGMTHGFGGEAPWMLTPERKFIAVVPGYDRHFAIAQHFGFQLVSVPMTPDGPDMDAVEAIVRDPAVKGMFCVPKYSNPDGVTYSEETLRRLAAMKTAPDFRVIWDLAYVVHDLFETPDPFANVYEIAAPFGTEDRFMAFASTSKITYAGAGVAAMGGSVKNVEEVLSRLTLQIISYDKINQLRHAAVFSGIDDVRERMRRHAAILRPKFETVLRVLSEELEGAGIARWSAPRGGYFISLDVTAGSAKYVGELCKACGLTLTGVGATYPYGVDPSDSNIRIAPSCPSVEELERATRLLAVCVKLAACRALREKAAE